MKTNHTFYAIEEWIVYLHKMKTTAVVSFKSFLLFTILLTTIMRLGQAGQAGQAAQAVPEKKNLKQGTLHVGKDCM